MHKLFSYGLIFAIVFSPLQSLPILDPNEISFRIPDSKMDFGDVSSWDNPHILQTFPSLLDKDRGTAIGTDYIFSKEGISLGTYNMDEVMKEEMFDKQPQISLLSRLQSKERKPYKKRAGNLSECFWKYCV